MLQRLTKQWLGVVPSAGARLHHWWLRPVSPDHHRPWGSGGLILYNSVWSNWSPEWHLRWDCCVPSLRPLRVLLAWRGLLSSSPMEWRGIDCSHLAHRQLDQRVQDSQSALGISLVGSSEAGDAPVPSARDITSQVSCWLCPGLH